MQAYEFELAKVPCRTLTCAWNGQQAGDEMLRGHVDGLTRKGVMGWAAADDNPDLVVEVSVFVDDRKIAQIACNLPRSDLLKLGTFGDGAHGFRFEFLEPLAKDADRRVMVRRSDTGELLDNGDIVIRPDESTYIRARSIERLIGDPAPIPAPCNPRGLFEAFALFDGSSGVYELLTRFELDDIKRKQAQYVVFGDLVPEAITSDARGTKYSARDCLNELLLSDDFQKNLIPLFLKAYPEKKRLIFVHVPKCAGTDLSANLMKKLPFLHQQMTQPDWMKRDDLFRAVSRLVLNVRFFDRIFVTGHNSLRYYTSRNLVRPVDRVFTILRDPIQIAVSQVNYVMSRLTADARSNDFGPDTREWLNILHIDTIPLDMPTEMVERFCTTILHDTNIVQPNSMCLWLGGSDAETATNQLVEHDVEITIIENYREWLHRTWGVVSETQLNQSEKFISAETLNDQNLAHLRNVCSEDIKLYEAIFGVLQRTEKLSVSGDELR
jgi:hypothetical protein